MLRAGPGVQETITVHCREGEEMNISRAALRTAVVGLGLGAALAVCSCDRKKESDDIICPIISGKWTITAHCDAQYVGKTFFVSQDECTFSTINPVTGAAFSGTIDFDGNIDLDNGQCYGSIVGDVWFWLCGYTCSQKFER